MKRILIIGAIDSILKRAKELGYETIVIYMGKQASHLTHADYFRCIDFYDLEGCLNYAKEMKIDGVIPANDTGVVAAGYIAETLELPGISFETAKIAKDKYRIHEILRKKNLDSLHQFFVIHNTEELVSIQNTIQFPVIIKPNDGVGSVGVYLTNTIKELQEKAELVLSVSPIHSAVIETFIEGKHFTLEAFVYKQEITILGLIEKIMHMEPDFASVGNILPANISEEDSIFIKDRCTNFIKALDITVGPINMDIIVDSNKQVHLVDLGARPGGNGISSHLIPATTGIDYIGNILKVALKEEPNFAITKHNCIVTNILNLTPGKIKELPDFTLFFDGDVLDIRFDLKVGDTIPIYKNSSTFYGLIAVKGNTIKEAMEKAEFLKEQLDLAIIRY